MGTSLLRRFVTCRQPERWPTSPPSAPTSPGPCPPVPTAPPTAGETAIESTDTGPFASPNPVGMRNLPRHLLSRMNESMWSLPSPLPWAPICVHTLRRTAKLEITFAWCDHFPKDLPVHASHQGCPNKVIHASHVILFSPIVLTTEEILLKLVPHQDIRPNFSAGIYLSPWEIPHLAHTQEMCTK